MTWYQERNNIKREINYLHIAGMGRNLIKLWARIEVQCLATVLCLSTTLQSSKDQLRVNQNLLLLNGSSDTKLTKITNYCFNFKRQWEVCILYFGQLPKSGKRKEKKMLFQ